MKLTTCRPNTNRVLLQRATNSCESDNNCLRLPHKIDESILRCVIGFSLTELKAAAELLSAEVMYASTKPTQSKPLRWGPAKTGLVLVILDWSGPLLLSSYSLVYASTFCEGAQ